MAKDKKLMTYKSRRRWSLVVLLVWLPIYCVIAVSVMNALPRFPLLIELIIYVFLGIAWAIPFKSVFLGVGKEDPDA